MKILERPLSNRQRKELKGLVAVSTTLMRVALFVIVVGLLGVLLRRIQIELIDAPPIWAIITVITGSAIYVRSRRWTGGKELRKRIREDLRAGVVRVTVIEPAVVTEIEEREDEGPSYIIETKTGESIMLTGQWLVWTKKKKFPWSKFEITEAPHSSHFFGVQNRGESIPVSAKRQALSFEQARDLGCFNHNYILLDDDAGKILLEA